MRQLFVDALMHTPFGKFGGTLAASRTDDLDHGLATVLENVAPTGNRT